MCAYLNVAYTSYQILEMSPVNVSAGCKIWTMCYFFFFSMNCFRILTQELVEDDLEFYLEVRLRHPNTSCQILEMWSVNVCWLYNL